MPRRTCTTPNAARTGDKYIRVTVILATVLSSASAVTFRCAAFALASSASGALLIFAAVEIPQLPGPPA